jgi:prepilin-type N-terminal cleavage/methylation domain-containing protein
MRKGFTLIEVMVAVMIVSIVIAALLKMQGNSSHKLLYLKNIMRTTQYSSFFIASSTKYGFENTKTNIADMLDDYELEDKLRKKLKNIKVNVNYETLDTLDSGDFGDQANEQDIQNDNDTQQGANLILEIGKSTIKSEKFSTSLIRVQLL